MKMNKSYLYAAMAATILVLSGCNDELMQNQGTKKYTGDEIVFGGRATFEVANDRKKAPATRTEYTGTEVAGKDENGADKKYEGINWITADKVRIYSPQAAGINPADYTVSLPSGNSKEASLTKMGEGALQWGSTTSAYDFYAVYPSPQQYPLTAGALDTDVSEKVLNGNTKIYGSIPHLQQCLGTPTNDGEGNYTLKPDMKYAYMVAHQHVADPTAVDANGVYLNFVPIATALEVEIVNNSGTPYNLIDIIVSSADGEQALYGDFTADLANLTDENGDYSFTGIPDGFLTEVTNTGTSISIPTYLDGKSTALDFDIGETLTFTIFMLPHANINDLRFTLVTPEGSRAGTTSGVTVTKHLKTYLGQMPLSKHTSYDQSRWVEYLPDNAYLHGLSIPGAGGAASAYHTDWSTNETYLEQSLTISQLWAQGIRCFEFTVDVATAGTDGTADLDLGSVNVFCNSMDCGLTLNNCIDSLQTLLSKYPDEFAMAIITYQQNSGWNVRASDGSVTQSRNPAKFMTQLNAYWATVTADMPEGTKTGLYNPNLTVKDARGTLYCIARPTSNGEDNYAEVNEGANTELTNTTYTALSWDRTYGEVDMPEVGENILVIHGWGALKDKWYTRGYTDCVYFRGGGNHFFNTLLEGYYYDGFLKDNEIAAKDADELVTMLGYRSDRDKRPGRPFDVSSDGSTSSSYSTLTSTKEYNGISNTSELGLTPNYFYTTRTSDGEQTNKAWVQEWARVVQTTAVLESNEGYAMWISSIDEKKSDISNCLDFALNKKITVGTTTYDDVDDVVFINSLCGYFIMDGLSASANSLTDLNVSNSIYTFPIDYYTGNWKLNVLTGANSTAGMCGDIASCAKVMNDYFHTLLDGKLSAEDYTPGSLGIILMDRVSEDKAQDGAKIPALIINNNFTQTLPSATASALSLRRDTYEDGDVAAAPQRREASESKSEEISIVWE